MSGLSAIGAVQGLMPADTWQALLQASLQEVSPVPAQALADATVEAPLATSPAAVPPATDRVSDTITPHGPTAEPSSTLVPLRPVVLQPLALQPGPALRWRVTDAPAWRELFDESARDESHGDDTEPDLGAVLQAADATPVPAWAQALLTRLRAAAATPATGAALRPAVQAWCVGLPVLLASPAGLATLQASRDASVWQWRRWPAQWRSARPAADERWWAVRLGLGPQGRPRTLRELGMSAPMRLAPGQVSCELRLGDVPPGLANWAAVLVQAPAAASLRALLAARPSLTWLLCSQMLWPLEGP